uniref:SH3KBP1-binding protein 1 n=1 Tax=Magallana gigas TaxID=29159 RepID=K1QB99_MAGGI|eukprot:XP_011430823.1 PREDICTED: SH3KBP1-binding protein 1 [Crassostrea gigas]
MPSSSSMSRSRSPIMCKDYDEVSIDEGDGQFEKEEKDIKVIDSLEKMPRETIQLDVGGYKFKTTRETLTRIPSKLSKLIPLKSANAASYFLDRNPEHFAFILNFLPNGEIDEITLPEEKGSLAAI